MKRWFYPLLLCCLLAGCASKTHKDASDCKSEFGFSPAVETSGTPGLAGKTVDENGYIDFDVAQLQDEILNTSRGEESKDLNDRIAISKAAAYRFYSHVKLEDGFYTLDIDSAAQINLSQQVFAAYKSNIDEINKKIEAARAAGKEVELSEITPEYLQSLLK